MDSFSQKRPVPCHFLSDRAAGVRVVIAVMSFDNRRLRFRPNETIFEDRFRQVEVTNAFRKLTCPRCNLSSIYKFRVQQIRRKEEIEANEEEEIRSDHHHLWDSIPRFAEIPETVKCKRCREILGIDTTCIY